MKTYITGDGVSDKHISRIAKSADCALWPTVSKPILSAYNIKKHRIPSNLIVLAGHVSEETLVSCLDKSVSGIVDANAMDASISEFIKNKNNQSASNSLGILMTCPVIYACDIAKLFTVALQQRLFFSKYRFEAIHLALHESIVNGLIHGNLQLSSNLRQSARDFIEYARILDERLNNPTYAQKSMSLNAVWDEETLKITIRDEGAGYAAVDATQHKQNSQHKSGRGLRLIAGMADSCTIDDFGREVTLSFLLNEKSEYNFSETDDEVNYPLDKTIPNLSGCRVLVMEDNLSTQTVLARLLNVIGIHNIEMAADGIEGLNKVVSYNPDLIILDITMPRMDGHEVLHHLKSVRETRHIPVLVQTASDTREMREKVFSSGATDFITKPINPLEFFARVKVHLENRLLIHNIKNQLEQIESELQSSKKMQVSMIPTSEHIEEARIQFGVDIAQHFMSSSALGGDFWQMFPIRGTQLGIYLCDFSGHGVAAALNTFRLHGIIAQMDKKKIFSPAEFLKTINLQLVDLLPRGQFASFFFGIYDSVKKTFTYSGAGSPPPIYKSGKKIQHLNTRGLPLGISVTATYTDEIIQLKPGDSIFMYSDALNESPDKNGDRYGILGLKKAVIPYLKTPDVHMAVRNFMHDFFEKVPPPPPDDVTVVLLKVFDK